MSDVSKARASIEVFFSYSHKDEELRDELSKHLSLLKRTRVITGWHDRRIGAGREWSAEIDHHLDSADVILLLVSSDFLASDYCYDVEVRRAMERHHACEARVIPVILRPVDFKGAPFGGLQALPRDARPVTKWSNRDDAFLDVAEGIRAAVHELTIGKVSHLLAKLAAAEALKNWPNVVNLGERLLEVLPDDESVRTRTSAAYVKRWSGRFGSEFDDLGRIEISKKRSEDYRQILVKMIDDLDRAIDLDPGNAEYYFLRGSAARFGSLKGCELGYERMVRRTADFDRAIECNPADPRYYYARAFEDKLDDNLEGALRYLRRASELGFPEKDTAFQQGRVYEELKDFQAALTNYERAAELGNPLAQIRIAGLSIYHPSWRIP